MLNKIAKLVRIISIPPVAALIMVLILFFARPQYFSGIVQLVLLILFLVIFPILAYPLQPILPKYCKQGREGQRNLAIIMAGLGYLCGLAAAAISAAPKEIWIIYLTYFFSAILIIIFNKIIKVRASGHACGFAGPIWALTYFGISWALLGLVLLIYVGWASLKIKRHTAAEFILGAVLPAIALLISVFTVALF